MKIRLRLADDGRPEWKYNTPSDRVHCWLGFGRWGLGFWCGRYGGELGLGWWIADLNWEPARKPMPID